MLRNARRLETTVYQKLPTHVVDSEVVAEFGVQGSLAMSGISSARFVDRITVSQVEDRINTTEFNVNQKSLTQVVPVPIPRVGPRKTNVTLMEWEGYVDEVVDDVVYARLRDVRSGKEAETDLAEIPVEEFSAGDRERLRPGVIFRWAIGISKDGQTQSRYSQLIVRDLPIWTRRDTLEAVQEAKDLSARLQARSHDSPSSRSD